MKLRRRSPDVYNSSARISLVSSFLASLFLGEIAPLDPSDVCGMTLWDIQKKRFNRTLIELTSGGRDQADELLRKLGEVCLDGCASLGTIKSYFVQKYGFSNGTRVAILLRG